MVAAVPTLDNDSMRKNTKARLFPEGIKGVFILFFSAVKSDEIIFWIMLFSVVISKIGIIKIIVATFQDSIYGKTRR